MKSEWRIAKLSSLVEMGNGRKRPLLDGDYPVYGGNGVMGYAGQFNSCNCIVVGRVGAYCGNVHRCVDKCWVSDNAINITVKDSYSFDFVYYLMQSVDFHHHRIGGAQPLMTQEIIGRQQVAIPSLSTQCKIAAVLSSLDDKIETNHAICRNLEEQADAFYKQYFVSGEKSSWNEGKLSDFIEVKYGKDHKKLADGTIPVYGSGGLMRYAERALYESESVLIPRKGTLNNVMLVMEPFWTVDTMFYSVMKVKNAAKFVFLFLKGKDLASMNAGSAVPSMTTEILNSMELRLPPKAVLDDFEHNVAPIYQTIATKKCENERLASLRDTLLPRLMSGELDVRDVHLR